MPLPTHRCVASRYCSRSIIRFLFDLSATTWPPLAPPPPPPPPASSRDKFDTCHPRCANLRSKARKERSRWQPSKSGGKRDARSFSRVHALAIFSRDDDDAHHDANDERTRLFPPHKGERINIFLLCCAKSRGWVDGCYAPIGEKIRPNCSRYRVSRHVLNRQSRV